MGEEVENQADVVSSGNVAHGPVMDAGMQSRLLEAFPKSAIGHKPQRNNKTGQTFNIEFVGHAAVTKRLCEVDPYWSWRPLVVDEYGRPCFEMDKQGNKVGFWIELTVGGVSRLGYGSVAPTAFESEKQLIGDALRNAAMRFGVAVDLWHRGELDSTLSVEIAPERQAAPPMEHKQRPASKPSGPVVPEGPPRPAAPSGPPPQPQQKSEPAPQASAPQPAADADNSAALSKLAEGDLIALDTLEAIDGLAKSQPLESMPKKLLVNLVLSRHEVMETAGRWKPGSLDRNIGKFGSREGTELSPDMDEWEQEHLVEFARTILGLPKP